MTVVKTAKGFQIKLENGKLQPKVYKTREEAAKRIQQMKAFKDKESVEWEVAEFDTSITEAAGGTKELYVRGVALAAETSRNGRTYRVQNLEENHGKSFNFLVGHRQDYDNPDHNVGEGTYLLENNKLMFEGNISNTASHPDIIEQVTKGRTSVSIQGGWNRLVKESDTVMVEGLHIPILAIVNKHVRGVRSASIDMAIAERLDMLEDEEIDTESEQGMEDTTMSEEKIAELQKQLEEAQRKAAELEKVNSDMKESEEKRQAAELQKAKEALVDKIVEANKDLSRGELMEKSMEVLQIMEQYETKSKKAEEKSHAVVTDNVREAVSEDVVIDERSKDITMSESAYRKFNEELRESIYRK